MIFKLRKASIIFEKRNMKDRLFRQLLLLKPNEHLLSDLVNEE
jgi:hypothetical protein